MFPTLAVERMMGLPTRAGKMCSGKLEPAYPHLTNWGVEYRESMRWHFTAGNYKLGIHNRSFYWYWFNYWLIIDKFNVLVVLPPYCYFYREVQMYVAIIFLARKLDIGHRYPQTHLNYQFVISNFIMLHLICRWFYMDKILGADTLVHLLKTMTTHSLVFIYLRWCVL